MDVVVVVIVVVVASVVLVLFVVVFVVVVVVVAIIDGEEGEDDDVIFSSPCERWCSNGGERGGEFLVGIVVIFEDSDSLRTNCNVPCCWWWCWWCCGCGCGDKIFIFVSPEWWDGLNSIPPPPPPSLGSLFCFFSADPPIVFLDCFPSSSFWIST